MTIANSTIQCVALLAVAGYAFAAHPCATCHLKEVSGYEKTGMGNSLTRVARQPAGAFRHSLSGSEFRITANTKAMTHTLEREGVTGNFPVEYAIGSGNHAFGYLVNVKGYLFQSPISYYTKRKIWDMAPGYEGDRNPDFTRPVTPECLLCHSGKSRPVAKTINRYEQPPFDGEAISCDRCHGNADAHLHTPSASNIINPRRLEARARDSVCEQCHLSGETRIPNPGRQIGDFQPGQNLEDVFSVYVFEKAADSRLKVVSHVEQLAQSTCRRKSGDRLWCGTCHNPHEKPVDVSSYYREKCVGCHSSILKTHAAPADDCVACHMPTRKTRDGGHTAFTDHEIQRRPVEADPKSMRAQALVPWHTTKMSSGARNLGLAYVAVGERDRSAFHLDEGFRRLSDVRSSAVSDPAIATGLGFLLLRRNKPSEAVKLFEEASKAEPAYAPYLINLATALKESGSPREAIVELESAIQLDPSLEAAYRKLAEIMRESKQPRGLQAVFERYLRFMPENVSARIALQAQ